jgi:HEPN domain-containing protein
MIAGGIVRPETEPWWRQSQVEIESARQLASQPERYFLSVWLVQHAVEKGLKALFLERSGVLPARTHDIELLGSILNVPAHVKPYLVVINPTFNLTRYPDMGTLVAPVDGVTDTDASEQLKAAEEVMLWIEAQLFPTSIQP